MTNINVQVPDSLSNQVRELARRDGISLDQLVSTAMAEKMSALMTADYLEDRARRGSQEKFNRALPKVGNAAPTEDDRLD